MADEAAATPRRSSRLKKLVLVVGALAAAALGGNAALNARAAGPLEARLEECRREVAARREAAAAPRPVLVDEPGDGDAVEQYHAIEWVFTAAEGHQQRPSWQAARPAMPAEAAALEAALAGKGYDLKRQAELVEHMEQGKAPSAPALAQFEAFRPLARLLSEGVRRRRCEWPVRWEVPLLADVPGLVALRAAAHLRAYEAHLAPDARQAALGGLELVAFGDDVGRHPSLIGTMIGVAIRSAGLQSLERTLRRPDLSAAECELVLATLPRARRWESAPMFATERLAARIAFLAVAGLLLDPAQQPPSPAEYGALTELPAVLIRQPWWMARELEAIEGFLSRSEAGLALPVAERRAARDRLLDDLEASHLVFVKVALPDLGEANQALVEANALTDIVRVLAAAQLHRLSQGAFPTELAALKERLGELPRDPFDPQGGPLRYRLAGDEVRCYSVWENGTDEGGDHRAEKIRVQGKDMVLVTRAGGE